MKVSTWFWSEEHRQICKIIETQNLWGNTFHRIWLPTQDTVVRVRAEQLKPLSAAGLTTPNTVRISTHLRNPVSQRYRVSLVAITVNRTVL
ncbi:hypothetical protein WA1_22420 [Scytonema hofmannii PCC 7110]|uniref:Uncharacterized protein n=1 Tax=Scytonema hofmannii PCC 7110 TaxID=128403 RepID=A0A139X9S1_9CYAN|nr:hypothetical protein [Scytonema hofmannii]KYC41448.1 hypothetical protein WA1_22420 [Scytonema hofmannii PCC 7110]